MMKGAGLGNDRNGWKADIRRCLPWPIGSGEREANSTELLAKISLNSEGSIGHRLQAELNGSNSSRVNLHRVRREWDEVPCAMRNILFSAEFAIGLRPAS
jgi:hypothetical protein